MNKAMRMPAREADLQAHIARLVEAGRRRNIALRDAEARLQQAERAARDLTIELARAKRENTKMKAELLSSGGRP